MAVIASSVPILRALFREHRASVSLISSAPKEDAARLTAVGRETGFDAFHQQDEDLDSWEILAGSKKCLSKMDDDCRSSWLDMGDAEEAHEMSPIDR
jgi:hypothetical protein